MAAPKLAIAYRILPDGDWQFLPQSQAATLLLFLHENRSSRVVWHDMYQALGSHEITRMAATLRRRGIIVICDRKRRQAGKVAKALPNWHGRRGAAAIGQFVRQIIDDKSQSAQKIEHDQDVFPCTHLCGPPLSF